MDGEGGPARAATWWLVDVADQEAAERVWATVAGLCRSDPRASLALDLRWIATGRGRESGLKACLCHAAGAVIGYAPLRLEKSRVSVHLGPLRAGSIAVERMSLVGAPVFAAAVRDQEEALTRALLTTAMRALSPKGVFYAYGARADSALFNILDRETATQPGRRVVRHGALYERGLIRLPARYDDYLRDLGRKTRETLRRQQRRARAAAAHGLRLEIFTGRDQIGAFLETATLVSRGTYQWHLYGSGLRDRSRHEQRLALCAANGWMRCFILFDGDTPLAFMMGCRYGDTYYSQEIGYDPDWGRFSIGNVLHCLIIEYLIAHEKDLRWFDFLFGDSEHKRNLRNATRTEGNFYVYPPTLRGQLAAGLVALDNRIAAVNRALAKNPLRIKLRRLLRKRAIGSGARDADTP